MARQSSPKRRRLDTDRFAVPSRASTPGTPRLYQSQYRNGLVSRASTPRGQQYVGTIHENKENGTTLRDDPEESFVLDLDWYGGDDNGHTFGDETHNPFGDSTWADQQREAALVEKKNTRRMNAKEIQRKKDTDAWETNRMLASNVAQRRDFNDDFEDDQDSIRVHLLNHDLKPPFLDGKTVFTKQLEPVSAVLDPQSDMAVFARKGSKVLLDRRQQRERQKQAQEATSVAGTAFGNLMGIKDQDADSALPDSKEGSKTNRSGFAQHLQSNQSQSAFSKSKTYQEQREYLPAFAVREELLRVIRDNQVVVVVGQTGSGKTTQLTQFLHEDGYGKHGLIGCTQPRRIAAVSVAKRVSEEMEVKLGELVGYAIRFENCTSKETIIKYMTEGVLLIEASVDRDLDKYSCIIMDEAHERAMNTDILMGLFKRVLARRRDLKLIITSATMNSKRFSDFYGGAPEFIIPGRTFPVDIQYSRSPCEDYVESAVKQVTAICVSQEGKAGDILVFMTGQEDIQCTCDLIEERLERLDQPPKVLVLPLYSQLDSDRQPKIFDKPPPGVRKVIVATNIAETSLTVDGIMYVVDSGFSKLNVFNPKLGINNLQVTPISQANASQRAGRAGRTGPGKSYHLYTERAFREEFYIQTIPEIQRTALAPTILTLKSLGVKDLLDFDFVDSPPQDAITTALFDLWALGALDNLGNLTTLGEQMAHFPLSPPLSKLLISSAAPEYSCSEEMLTIVSMISSPPVFDRRRDQQAQADSDAKHEKFFAHESDHLTLLNVYTQWAAHGRSDAWARHNSLHPRALHKAAETREQLAELMAQRRMRLVSAPFDPDTVRRCVCAGYYHQAARVRGAEGQYVNLRTKVEMRLHPTSALAGLGFTPDYVVYNELVNTGRACMSVVTAVDPHWLAELGAVFYSIKERAYDGKNVQVSEAEFSRKEEIEREMAHDREKERLRLEAEDEKLRVRVGNGVIKSVVGNVVKKISHHGAVKKPITQRRRV